MQFHVLDSWWDLVASASPMGFLGALGVGPDMRDPLAHLDAALGGNESSTTEYQTGHRVAGIAQIGLIVTPEGGETAVAEVSPRIAGFRPHGFVRRWGSRGDGGVNLRAMYDAVKSPLLAVSDVARQ